VCRQWTARTGGAIEPWEENRGGVREGQDGRYRGRGRGAADQITDGELSTEGVEPQPGVGTAGSAVRSHGNANRQGVTARFTGVTTLTAVGVAGPGVRVPFGIEAHMPRSGAARHDQGHGEGRESSHR
jgi:hypothetical protein